MIMALATLVVILICSFGILAVEIHYRATRNMYPFCKRGDKHEK